MSVSLIVIDFPVGCLFLSLFLLCIHKGGLPLSLVECLSIDTFKLGFGIAKRFVASEN